MSFKNFHLLLLGLLFSFSLCAQDAASIDVNKDVDVAKVYEQVVKEGYGTPEVYLKLANAHYFKANYDKAKIWFEKVLETEKSPNKKLLFRYKQTLKALKLDISDNPYLSVSSVEVEN